MCHEEQDHDHPHLPCLHCHPHNYIRMVQKLIERCLLLGMGRNECVEALAHHATIPPLVTVTVWKELTKENKCFFQAYFKALSPSPSPYRRMPRRSRWRRRKQWK